MRGLWFRLGVDLGLDLVSDLGSDLGLEVRVRLVRLG
jgi:hypothetical protein